MTENSFRVLFVCSGNLCRSAIAEQFLASRVGPHVRVTSAGTIATDGAAMPRAAMAVSKKYGGFPDFHRARQLNAEEVRASDLILTATRAHRADVVRLLPKASRVTFTISEFVWLLGAGGAVIAPSSTDPGSVVAAVRSARGLVPPPEDPTAFDLEDPYGRSDEVFEAVAARLDELIDLIMKLFAQQGVPL